jgi:hypothetical protein
VLVGTWERYSWRYFTQSAPFPSRFFAVGWRRFAPTEPEA